MRTNARWWLAGVGLLILGVGGWAADEKEVAAAVQKVADLVAKKDLDGAKKQAADIAKKVEDIEPVMDLMKPREDGGLGVTKGADPKTDGIEKKMLAMDKTPLSDKDLKAQSADLVKMANTMAAISLIAQAKPNMDKGGGKDPKKWIGWAEDMTKGAQDVAAAADAKDPAAFKKAVSKLNSVCNSCHSVYK
jgi:cytochrome c556